MARSDSLTVTIPHGLSTIADPFISGGNLISQVLTNVPEGTQLYKFDAVNQRWLVNQFQFGAWVRAEQTLAPGEGAFIRNPSNSFSITFTGTAPTNFVLYVRSGYNLLSLPTDGTSQLNHQDNDLLREWDSTRTNYSPFLISLQDNWYDPLTGQREEPSLRAGESFFYYRTPAPGETLPRFWPSVYLNNYAPASGLHAPISSRYGCFGSTFVAQLYLGFGDPGPFNNSTVIDRPELKAAIALAGNPTVMLSGIVPTGLSFQLEESYDLSHWTNFASFTSPPESWSVLVTNVPDFSRRFFRLRSAP